MTNLLGGYELGNLELKNRMVSRLNSFNANNYRLIAGRNSKRSVSP